MPESTIDLLLRIRSTGNGLDETKRDLREAKDALGDVEDRARGAESALRDLGNIERLRAGVEVLRDVAQWLSGIGERQRDILRTAEALGVTTERAQALTAAARDTGAAVEDLNKAFSDDALAAYNEQASLFGAQLGPDAAESSRRWAQATGELQTMLDGLGSSLMGPIATAIQGLVDGMSVAGIVVNGVLRAILANWSSWADALLIQVRGTLSQLQNLAAIRSVSDIGGALAGNRTIGMQTSQLVGARVAAGAAEGGSYLSNIPGLIGQYFQSQTSSRAAIANGLAGATGTGGGAGGGGAAASKAGGSNPYAADDYTALLDAETARRQAAVYAAERERYASTPETDMWDREAAMRQQAAYRASDEAQRAAGSRRAGAMRTGLGVAGGLLSGNVAGAIGAANPVAGAIAGMLSGLGQQGATAVLEQIRDNVMNITKGIVELPKLLIGLVAQLPAIAIGLVKALVFELPKALYTAISTLPQQMSDAIADALGLDKDTWGRIGIDESGKGGGRTISIGGVPSSGSSTARKAAGSSTAQQQRGRRSSGGGDVHINAPVYGGIEGLRELMAHIRRAQGSRGVGA